MKNSRELIEQASREIELIEKQDKPNYAELYIIGYADGAEDMRKRTMRGGQRSGKDN